MSNDPSPYREHPPRPLAPYAAAWREYAWRVRCAFIVSVIWWLGVAFCAWRWRTLILFVIVPLPFKALLLRSFRCPRCHRLFATGPGASWLGAAGVAHCVACGLPRGAPADPDESAMPPRR